ncbi:hypothetical protein QY95_04015 [Bacillus thermotolerans]|uniref:Uncharacterized protein n=1 Tax=Bacillus thermotolerans TaxID=1221996 RepID=A0A0F5HLE4_BACTR|nr:hypothetical protein QY95_04015 [Bacillus thermotolerans]
MAITRLLLGYFLYDIIQFSKNKYIEGIHPSKLNKISCQSLFDV